MTCQPGRIFRYRLDRIAVPLFVMFICLPSALTSAAAQGFQVRPMSVEAGVPTGQKLLIPIEITKTRGLEENILDLEIAHLTQTPAGGWQAVPLEEGPVHEYSAAEWMEVAKTVSVPSQSSVRVEVAAELPRLARGTYSAALLVSTRPPEGEGLRLSVRFLIPIILSVEGRPVRQSIAMTDAALSLFVDSSPALSEQERSLSKTTLLNVSVENRGGTYSRISGGLYLDYARDGERWQQVRYTPLDEKRILPGVALTLPLDLERRLPKGRYRVRGELFVDGRRTAPLRKELEFEGDPEITEVSYELTLGLDPDVFEFDYVAGATRSGVIAVENPGIEPIRIALTVALPEGMGGRAMGDVVGESLSAADWVEVTPQSFTLRPGQRRNVRLVARYPREEARFENYYAELRLVGFYEDGQKAGESVGYVEISRGEQDEPVAAVETLRLSASDVSGVYVLSARIANIGNVLMTPSVQYVLVNASGTKLIDGWLSNDAESGVLMPLMVRSYGGSLDMSKLAPGEYRLQAAVVSDDLRVADHRYSVLKHKDGSVEFAALGPQSSE